jgi:hypothetical protein
MNGIELIAKERQRQTEEEGWADEHDDRYDRDELVRAAICYSYPPYARHEVPIKPGELGEGWEACSTRDAVYYVPEEWPWSPEDYKPSNNRVKDLVRAGSLIAAEIDRLLRKGPA